MGLSAAPFSVAAHQLVVFAVVDCEIVRVEAKFSNGNAAQQGEVRVLDGKNILLTTLELETDGTAAVPLGSLDHSSGLVIEVDTGSHDNYWMVTPEDIARACGS
jgi:nickel transport protein